MHQNLQLDDDVVCPESATVATDERKFARYAKWVCGILVLGGLLIISFVAVMDPYHLFRLVDIAGVNRIKPLPEQYREQIKLAQAGAIRPNALLFGNSRIEVGLDPASPQLRSRDYSTYNLALAGTSLATAQDMFSRARSETAPPALAVLGVEFLDFLVSPTAVSAPLEKPAGGLRSLQWRFDTVFSIKSLSDAWLTLRLQKTSYPETMTPRGHTPLHEYNLHARREGYHMIFQQRALENAKSITRKPHALYGADGRSASIEHMRRMLATMAQDGTDVHLIIYPYHAQLMAMFNEAGLQVTFEEWKSLLVREVEAIRSKHPLSRITLWDFSGFSPVQCERIPAPGDTRAVTRFYWEAGHFKSSVGELILQKILGGESAIGFGFALTPANMEQNRQRIATERDQCSAADPEIFTAARSLIGAARKQL